MRVGGQRHTPAALTPGQRPGIRGIRGSVGPRAGLDGCGKSRHPTGTTSPERPASSESVYRLSYHASPSSLRLGCTYWLDSIVVFEPVLPLEGILTQQAETKRGIRDLSVLTVIKLTEGGSFKKRSLRDRMWLLQKSVRFKSRLSDQQRK